MRNREVVGQFLMHRPASGSNLHTDGRTLVSYGTIIAEWENREGDFYLAINTTKYSKSTTRHQSYLLNAWGGRPRKEYEGPPAKMWYSWRDGLKGKARPNLWSVK